MLTMFKRRHSPARRCLPGQGGDPERVALLERRGREAGMLSTGLRRLVLHGMLATGERATAKDVWRTLACIVDGRAPTLGSVQRILNEFVRHGVIARDVGADRVWRYGVPDTGSSIPSVVFVNAETGIIMPGDASEIDAVVVRLAAERGYVVRGAAITVAAMPVNRPVSSGLRLSPNQKSRDGQP